MKLDSTKQNIGNTHKIPTAAELALLCYFVLLGWPLPAQKMFVDITAPSAAKGSS